MDDFSLLFGFYGLIFGLAIAEVASRFADAIDAHPKVRLGWLTPLLTVFVLMDITSFWLWGWSLRHIAVVEWSTVFAGLVLTMSYFLAASMLFPRHEGWTSLDDHYWHRKRLVLAGVILPNVVTVGFMVWRVRPALNDGWFFFWQALFWVPFLILPFSRRRRVDIALLVFLIAQYFLVTTDILPSSRWGDAVGINFSPRTPAP